MILSGSTEYVEIEEQVAGLEGGHLRAAAAADGGEDGGEGVALCDIGGLSDTRLLQQLDENV